MSNDNLQIERNKRRKMLRAIWQIVDQQYPFFDEKNVNWDNIFDKYNNLLDDINSYEEFYQLADKMLIELHDPHTRIISSPFYKPVTGMIPLILCCIEGKYYVEQNPLGGILKRGMEVISVNGASIQQLKQEVYTRFGFDSKSSMDTIFIKEFHEGKYGRDINVTALDLEGNTFTENFHFLKFEELIKEQMKKETAPTFTQKLCTTKEYDKGVGYIRILTFRVERVIEDLLDALHKFENKRSIIIDVRGNDGGVVPIVKKVTEYIAMDSGISVYQVKRKHDGKHSAFNSMEPINITQNSLTKQYRHVVVLCDEKTMSSAEFVFLRGLKLSHNKICIVGTETGGLNSIASLYTLKDGTKLQVTTSKLIGKDMSLLGKEGVIPDFEVRNTARDFAEQRDRQMEFAISICNK